MYLYITFFGRYEKCILDFFIYIHWLKGFSGATNYETICELYDEFKSIDSIIRHKEKEISKRVNNHSVGKICSLFLALVLSMHWLVNTRFFGSILQTIKMVGIYRRILDWYLK